MAVDIVMPRLSDSMEEGTVLRWLVAEGSPIAEGEPLVEVETDKASVTYESEHAGALLKIVTGPGESAAVGAVIAVVGDAGEAVDREAVNGEAGSGRRVRASPLARRVAAELGVDLAGLAGSGPHGRVIRADVERRRVDDAGVAAPDVAAPRDAGGARGADASRPPETERGRASDPEATPGPSGGDAGAKGDVVRRPLSRLQQTVARRMAESRATVPDFELRVEVDMSAAAELRAQLRELSGPVPSYNDLVVKAAALALREFPRVNGAYRDGALEHYSRVNVGIAVAADDALVVPTILDADRRSLREIAAVARELAAKVRDGSITPAELAGGTFSVSNLGMFGIDSFSAVVNAPQAAILAVGSLKPRPIVDADGAVVARPTVVLTLACDHRILYGADGARFLARVRELLERPLALLVG